MSVPSRSHVASMFRGNNSISRLRRRKSREASIISISSLTCTAAFLLIANAILTAAFSPRTVTSLFQKTASKYLPLTQLLVSHYSTRDETLWLTGPITSSWSKPDDSDAGDQTDGTSKSSGSRFGVRKRVKAVLEKAKSRTGLVNRNSDASIVAEAASIGGLFESSDLFVYPPTTGGNGYRNGAAVSSSTTVQNALQEMQGRKPLSNGTDVDLVLESTVKQNPINNNDRLQVDAVLSSGKVEPLPFRLPQLTTEQREILKKGERVQEQSKMGREGSGYVVLDVKAPPYIVWECLLDFEKYPEYIGTVRSMTMFTNMHLKQSYITEKPVLPGTGREMRHYGTASNTRASFVLSKFQLNIAAVHKYRPHPDGHYMEFSLDKACRNVVLKDAKGIWYTENEPDGRKGYTRVWLLCELAVSRMLPTFIVDYTAKRAMPRASNWIKPTVAALKREFQIQDDDDEDDLVSEEAI